MQSEHKLPAQKIRLVLPSASALLMMSPEANSSVLVAVKGSEDVLGKSFCVSAEGGGGLQLSFSSRISSCYCGKQNNWSKV